MRTKTLLSRKAFVGWSATARRVGLVAGSLALVAGCSGDDDNAVTTDAPTTTAAATTTESPVTTEAPTTTAAPTTTEAPSTTESPVTTEAPTTTAPVTTVPSDEVPLFSEAAVEAAVIAIHDLWTECTRQMPDCDPVEVSTTQTTGVLATLFFADADFWSSEGVRAEVVDREIFIESVEIDEAAAEATVLACENDGSVLLEPDGSVFRDVYLSQRFEYTLVVEGDRWLGSDWVEVDFALGEEEQLCAR